MDRVIKLLEDQNELLTKLVSLLSGTQGDDHMLTTHEAAKYLRMSYDRLLQWVKEGKIPHTRPGRRVLFNKKALDEWRTQQEQQSLKKTEPSGGYGTLRKIVV